MTDYQDPVFPLPEPTFLWVHDLITHTTSASVTVGRGRKWTNQSASVTFVGYATAPDRREVSRAASHGVRLDAVILAPHGVVVDEADQLEVPATPISTGTSPPPSTLVGRYGIHAVRPNPSHVRILCTRIRGEDPAHAG